MGFFVFVFNLYSVELVIDMQQEILIDKGLEFFNGYVVFFFFYIAIGEPSFILTILVLQ